MLPHTTNIPVSPRTRSLDAGGATAVGRVRERNEDQFVIARMGSDVHILASSVPLRPGQHHVDHPAAACEATLLVVADGMGGCGGGDVASTLAVQTVIDELASFVPDPRPGPRGSLPGVRAKLTSVVRHCDDEVRGAADVGNGVRGMGTTLTVAYVIGRTLYVAHVGDSRCYLLRAGTLYQLTNDHTVAEQMGAQLGEPIPSSSPWHHVLTNAIGASEETSAAPDVRRLDLYPGDVLLLCSDGVTKHLGHSDLAEHLAAAEAADTIVHRILAETDARGGTDNSTAVVARLSAASWPPEAGVPSHESSAYEATTNHGDSHDAETR